ncbi:MAG: SEC-C domain-containing protein [Chlorobium sp.]
MSVWSGLKYKKCCED